MQQDLDSAYEKSLKAIAEEIQASEELSQYLEEEEEEHYLRLKELYEPRIGEVHAEVAAKDPLQLIALENRLLQSDFEGLYLPKILGYSVLRGEIDEEYKYLRPQNHFKDILLTICGSANFDILKKRIGQSIQIGFALSSDIWVTSLINEIDNKRVRYYLQSQKQERYHLAKQREIGYNRYKRQFRSDNYMTAEFPEKASELKVLFPSLKSFLIYRIRTQADNSSLITPIVAFIDNKDFHGSREHLQVMMLYGHFFELSDDDSKHLAGRLNELRKAQDDFEETFLNFLLEMHHSDEIELDPEADQRMSSLIDKRTKDDLTEYYKLTDIIHGEGYNREKAQEAVKKFYVRYPGLSVINECVRQTIFAYFARYIRNLDEESYVDFFEITKLFPVYMDIFANQQFNQDLKELCLDYVHRLLKRYTDKRGKDYQDIKKFVSTTFRDFGFLTEKQIKALFKTKRKRRKKSAAK
ncbi:MAG: hypothetical protein R3350_01645 [Saprospiraceae bacterium]|nr:hypothetical protein [Saprospiraceae bacterium]